MPRATKNRKVEPTKDPSSLSSSGGDDDEGGGGESGDMTGITVSRLPSGPHPSVARLEELDFDILPEGFFVISYGARRTGKTHSTEALLHSVKDRFDFAYLFSSTATLHKNSKEFRNFDMIRDEAKFDGFNEDILRRIIERQKRVMEFNDATKLERDKKPNKTLLIFDDFVHEKAVRYSKTFTELPVLGRHYDLSVICLTQGYSQVASGGLNKATRQNADLVITFLPRNLNDVERMSEWYLTKEKLDNMWFTKSVCQEQYQCLAIDLTNPHETEFENYCYKYIAPPVTEKYELGKVQWKLYREERKRQRKAALAMEIENGKYFNASNSDLDKRQKIGQATGLPDKAGGRMSMFDAMNLGTGFR